MIITTGAKKLEYRSKQNIELEAMKILYDYDSQALNSPTNINEELLVECHLELPFEVKRLSTDNSILGASSYTGGVINVYDKFSKKQDIYIEPNTIVIDEHLEHENLAPRRRFTIAHEIGHLILHEDSYEVYARCGSRQLVQWNSLDRAEKQANMFAAALLMPCVTLEDAIERSLEVLEYTKEDFKRYAKLDRKFYDLLVNLVAGQYGVSYTCALLRLKNHPELWA
jgi:Zn-dependent peptidase ImmA (M78 family)